MKKLATLTLLGIFISQPVIGMDKKEEKEFQQKVQSWSKLKRGGLLGLNIGKLGLSCGFGVLGTGFSAVLDTLPFGSAFNKFGFAEMATYHMDERYKYYNEDSMVIPTLYIGGALSVPSDLITMLYDISDGELKDGEYNKPFALVRASYGSTIHSAKGYLGEKSACQDSFDAIKILYNPNKEINIAAEDNERNSGYAWSISRSASTSQKKSKAVHN